MAVIDGQQRLTSLYLGLKGTYAYKMPRKWWKDNEDCLPTRRLYINLSSQLPKDDERKMIYNFKFLADNEFAKLNKTEDLFLVGNIYDYREDEALDDFIDSIQWKDKKYAKSTLRKLRKVILITNLLIIIRKKIKILILYSTYSLELIVVENLLVFQPINVYNNSQLEERCTKRI